MSQERLAREAVSAPGESLEQFEQLADSAPVLIWISGSGQEMQWFNRGWRDFTGRAMQQDQGEGWLQAVHPEDRERCLESLRAACLSQESFSSRLRLQRQDGAWRWMVNNARPRFNDQGEFLGFIGVCIDHSEPTELLRRFEKIAAHVPGMVYQYQRWPDGHSAFPYSSRGIEQIYGLTPEQVSEDASAVYEVLHPDDRERVAQTVIASAEQLIPWRDEYRVVLKDGRSHWVEGEASPELQADGSVLWHGYIRDVTQRRQAEELIRESDERLQLIFNGINDGVWDWDLLRNQVYYSPRWMAQLGYSPDELEGRYETFVKLLHPDDLDPVMEQVNDYLAGEIEHLEMEMRLRHKQGGWRWIMSRGLALRNAEGRPYRVLGSHTDIEQRKGSESRLQLAASVFDTAHEGIMITDLTGCIIDVNQAFSAITGFSREEAIGKTPHLLNSGHHAPAFFEQMWQQLRDSGHWHGEVWNRRKDGALYAEMLNVSAVRDEQGQVHHYVSLFSDITAQKAHQRELERIAHYDALTGLPNRSLFSDRLGQAMANAGRRGQRIVLAFIDLDGFKAVNDTHGHKIGDQLLREVARRMKEACREGDTVARLGGDEFVAVYIDLADLQAGEPLLRRLLLAASQPVQTEVGQVQVSASVGVAFYPQKEPIAADQLLRQADQAMYKAKLAGKNRYHVFDEAQDRSLRNHTESVLKIEAGLEREEFELYYQPKVNMRTGRVLGVEALIRWQHPQRGLLLPAEFLDEVDNDDVGVKLGDWVLNQALAQLLIWQREGIELGMSVNIAAYHLQQPDFIDRLKALLAQYQLQRPYRLELEVLETSALSDMERVSELIRRCHSIGVSFALDDFGTGYSSLTYLKRLPAHVLKIDRGFVRDMLNDAEELAIIDGVLGLAGAFRRQPIAEGVESLEHSQMLLHLGCELAQGFFIARPMPESQLRQWLGQWRPDPSWSQVTKLDHELLPLLYAMAEHRSWVGRLDSYLQGLRVDPPELDHTQCRFGEWLLSIRETPQHAGLNLFEELEPLHLCVHEMAEALIEQHKRGDTAGEIKHLEQLHECRDQLLARLRNKIEEGSAEVS